MMKTTRQPSIDKFGEQSNINHLPNEFDVSEPKFCISCDNITTIALAAFYFFPSPQTNLEFLSFMSICGH
jgi:hypothetical protein